MPKKGKVFNKNELVYLLLSLLLIVALIVWDIARYRLSYINSRTYQYGYELWIMSQIAPVVAGGLVFVRTLLQKNIANKKALLIDVVIMVLAVSASIIFFNYVKMGYFLKVLELHLFVIAQTVCAVLYDLYRCSFFVCVKNPYINSPAAFPQLASASRRT